MTDHPSPALRLDAFSDGVFAIVATLLVIELKLPELHNPKSAGDLFHAVWAIRSHLASYVICFLFVAQLWVAHTYFFRMLARTDAVVTWLNALLLMFVCLLPFVTAILGEYPENPGSVLVFGMLFSATSAVFGPMSWYVRLKGLHHPGVDDASVRRGMQTMTLLDVLGLVPLTFAYWSPKIAMLCYLLVILGYMVAQAQFRPPPAPTRRGDR